MPTTRGVLALEDGQCFSGISVGHEGFAYGEVVFNTSMTGYQEVLTDPSYAGQIVTMTYPLIGNTGINDEDNESAKPRLRGFVLREISATYSNWRAKRSLQDYVKENQIVTLSEIDTRSLTRHIRTRGAMRAVIGCGDWSTDELVRRAKESPRLEDENLVELVTASKPYKWDEPATWHKPSQQYKRKIVVYDFGIKWNMLRLLVSYGANVEVVPASTSAETVLMMKPDGVMLSNGPGDPARLDSIVSEVKKLITKLPVFGICLGHQLIGRAYNAKTFKLKFGHRGANQPVQNLKTGQVEISLQNHGFCVDSETLPNDVEVLYKNLNDNTVEGIAHKNNPVFSVQYHPEAAAGPHDSVALFEKFLKQG
ncbi:MAG: glutamine-hydrolyzing carbamoyl-phosphate synthase small subunit [Planctomycetaceae bacterium]|jgi:carbamoyl-phosphate synthase small subunit|nr:glutamine-hydrolyzing carbamoyl-phosphate synthase small subunit [Planctomycetaceae bacterium]